MKKFAILYLKNKIPKYNYSRYSRPNPPQVIYTIASPSNPEKSQLKSSIKKTLKTQTTTQYC